MQQPPTPDNKVLFLAVALAVSGACNLACEVLWMRQLSIWLGSTTIGSSTTLAAFMGGLGLGAALGGRLADRRTRALTLYGMVEVVAGACAALVIFALPWVGPRIAELGAQPMQPIDLPGRAGQLAWCALVLVPPAVAMGAAFPVAVRAWEQLRGGLGRGVGALYAANTVGACGGALFSWYVAVPAIGVGATLWVAAIANVGVGLVALGLARAWSRQNDHYETNLPAPCVASGQPPELLVMSACVLGGFAAFGCEVIWTRVLSMVIGASTTSFTLMAAALLLGTAVGSAAAASRRGHTTDPWTAVRRLTAAFVTVALTCFAVLWLFSRLPELYVALHRLAGGSIWGGAVDVAHLGIAMAIMTIPAALIGAAFTYAIAAHRSDAKSGEHNVGTWAGNVYAASTLGNVAGALACGLVAIPWLGTDTAARVCAAAFLGAALLGHVAVIGFARAHSDPGRRRRLAFIEPVAALVAFVLAWWWVPTLGYGPLTSGVFAYAARYAPALDSEDRRELQTSLRFVEDGQDSLVTVREQQGLRFLQLNGKTDASTETADMQTQVLLAALPALLHPHVMDEILMVGLGSGITLGSLRRLGAQNVTVIEREGAVVRAAALFDDLTDGVTGAIRSGQVQLIQADARPVIATLQARYTLVCSEPSNPWMVGVAPLFSEEHLQNLERRMAEGGVLIQWLQGYNTTPEILKITLRTMLRVFPQATLWSTDLRGGDFVLLASDGPLEVDIPSLQARLSSNAALQSELLRVGVSKLSDILGRFVASADELAAFVGEGPVHTDDRPLLEWLAPRLLVAESEPAGAVVWRQDFSFLPPRARWPSNSVTTRTLLLEISRSHVQNGHTLAAAQVLAAAADAFPSDPDVVVALARVTASLGKYQTALSVIDQIYQGDQRAPVVLIERAKLVEELGLHAESLRAFAEALASIPGCESLRVQAQTHLTSATAALESGRFDDVHTELLSLGALLSQPRTCP